MDAQCCFCGNHIDSNREMLEMVVAAATRLHDEAAPTQSLWCHVECLGSRLWANVPFDAEAFWG